jgi:hypothetical protein
VPSPETKPGQRKLSEVARHIKQPAGIVSTGWPAVQDRLRQFGIPFDMWQQGAGRLLLAKRGDGLYAAGVGGAIMSIPRQVGKTYLIGWIVFALCTLHPNLTVIWTAHHGRTTSETFAKMRAMASKPKVQPYIDGKPRVANGEQSIAFKTGSRILFGARDQGFGLGFDMVDILVLDEAQRVREVAMADMVPATNAAPNGLVILMGTPPRPTDNGDVFESRRLDALTDDPDTLYIEISADPGAKVIDWAQVAKANPSYPHRTSKTAILRMQKLLGSDEAFYREGYGIWDEVAKTKKAIPFTKWSVLKGEKPSSGRVAFGVKFSPDGSTVAIAGGIRPADGPIHIEGFRQENLGEGLQWLVDFLAKRAEATSLIVVDGKAGAGALVAALRDEGLTRRGMVIMPSLEQVAEAHSMLLEAVKSGGVSHLAQGPLDDQVKDAVVRPIGKSGAFGWEPDKGDSVALLDAATYAFWGAKVARVDPNASRSDASRRRAANTGRRGR